MDLSYILNELGEERDKYFNAIAPPIVQTSNFTFPSVDAMRDDMAFEYEKHFYTRGNNPTVEILRKKLAALEGAEDALVVSSGSTAISTAIVANVQHGDHIVSVLKPYTWTYRLMTEWLPRFGVTTTFVDGTDPENFEQAIQPNTKIIYLESPNSFTFELQDLAAVADIAKKRRAAGQEILTMIDNSYSTPLYQQPIRLGIDISIHSASKYIGGHSDLIAGVICGTNAMMKKLFHAEYMTFGGIISPMNAWLMIRGLRTLPLRLERSQQSAKQVLAFLENHPKVQRVYYPFSEQHPQHELARRQMLGCGGLLTIALKTDQIERVDAFADGLKRFLLGVSWGGHESLVFPASVSYSRSSIKPGEPNANPENFNKVRLYIGLEDPSVLIDDLAQALDKV
jgi:cystathionine beta-lyase/cystathionine gamma-synthase